jgi:hypothetical protein
MQDEKRVSKRPSEDFLRDIDRQVIYFKMLEEERNRDEYRMSFINQSFNNLIIEDDEIFIENLNERIAE